MATKLDLTIPAPNIQTFGVTIKGTTPLIFHKWSEKAIKMIQDKQAKKVAKAREAREPEKEYEDSFYYDRDGEIAFPANAVKQSMVGACRFLGKDVQMTVIRGAVFIVGDVDGLIPVQYTEKEMRTDMVTVGIASADVRYRGQLNDWSMDLTIKYNADVITAEQTVNLLQTAGFSQGLGEWRAEKNGSNGAFEIATD